VDGIITEDSDLLVFGARNTLFKFDTSATVIRISRADFGSIHSATASFVGWTDAQFREMAMLSGCDYLPSIPGIGLITAAKLMRKHRTVEKALQFLRLEGTKRIPKGYLDDFRMAELAFLHQRVYDPISRQIMYLTPPNEDEWDEEKEAYVGWYVPSIPRLSGNLNCLFSLFDPQTAREIAEGNRDPITLKPMEDINPSYQPSALRNHRPPLADTTRLSINRSTTPDPPSKKSGILGYFGERK